MPPLAAVTCPHESQGYESSDRKLSPWGLGESAARNAEVEPEGENFLEEGTVCDPITSGSRKTSPCPLISWSL